MSASDEVLFLKLGGSLITDKTATEEVRPEVLARLAAEIREARQERPSQSLLLGHGSGSFGHVHAARHGTRQGVHSEEEWQGFAAVSAAASRLNEMVTAALLAAGLPALSLQPSASVMCRGGHIVALGARPVEMALQAGLMPVVFGDVAFDELQGGTIVSTEEVMMALAHALRPRWLLLAGDMPGVMDGRDTVVPLITPENFDAVAGLLRGSRGTDVTGGMAGKVQAMLNLATRFTGLQIRIFSGLVPGNVTRLLVAPEEDIGTVIRAEA